MSPCNPKIIYKETEEPEENNQIKQNSHNVLVSTRYGIREDPLVDNLIDKEIMMRLEIL